jgi:hypothetical protein
MAAWNWKRWIGITVLAFAVVWISFTRHLSPNGLIGGMMGGIFATITGRRFQTFWIRLQTAQQVSLIPAASCVLWFLLFSANRNDNNRIGLTSVETAGFVVLCGLYWPFSKAMDALWLRFRRHRAK